MRKGRKYDAAHATARFPSDPRGRGHHLAALSLRFLAALVLVGSAPPLSAQAPPPPALSTVTRDFIGGLPKSLLGAKASRFAGTVSYIPKRLGGGPMVMIGALPASRASTYDQLRTSARTAFSESGLREIVREGTFQAPQWPGASAFFGEYKAGSGLKQVWALETGTDSITVMVTYFDERDSARIEAAITDIFGGAVVTASRPTE